MHEARIDPLPCPILVSSRDGLVLQRNTEFDRVLQAPANVPLDTFFPPASRVFLQTHVWPMLLRDGEVREVYLELLGPGNERLPAIINARTTEAMGQPVVIWMFFVATQRQRFEAELLAARRKAQQAATELASANDALARTNAELARAHAELTRAHAQLAQFALQVQSENEELAVLSSTDPLTKLGNRRALERKVLKWAQNVPPGAVASMLMIDIDHFKPINDRWGHDEGDRVLSAVAAQLLTSVRTQDLLVRYGGEEFTIWLPHADASSAHPIAERVHRQVTDVHVDGEPITVSIGIATATLEGAAHEPWLRTLIAHADTAMYRAKAEGRNRTAVYAVY